MKKIQFCIGMSIGIGLCIVFGFTQTTKSNDFIGRWAYTCSDAPYPYSSGEMIFSKENEQTHAQLIFANKRSIETEDVTITNDTLSLNIFVEGGKVLSKIVRNEDEFSGIVYSPEGNLKIMGKRIKSEE